ncbi:MAG: hypothetical protein KKC42_03610, partial [Candidatus Omnitrophica bacterium]|nr:hypothetical protein [Candidatus Omnitrophota bacterium]
MVELRQRQELRRLLIPELNQSLKILALPLLDLKAAIQEELLDNPVLEELPPKNRLSKERNAPLPFRDYTKGKGTDSADFRLNLISKKLSLQDI